MSDLIHAVRQSIEAHRLLRRGQGLLVAVSGGVDSMVLLHVLHALAPAHRWRLTVAHFNHQLRGADSEADEAFVRRVARRLGCPCETGRADVRAFARERKLSLEMAARELRHEFLARAARRRGVSAIALGHHVDDQVELFFLRLLRGASCEGLGGMKWKSRSPVDRRVWLVRPLLDQEKADLRAFATEHHIAFREDASNESLEIQRNRLRHHLLPLLRAQYQPALNRVVLRLMQVLADTAAFVARQAAWAGRRAAFDRLDPVLQRQRLHDQLRALGLPTDHELIEQLRLAAGTPVSVAPGLHVLRDAAGQVSVKRVPAPVFDDRALELDLKGELRTALFGDVIFRWQELAGARLPPRRAGREYFDADRVGSRVVLRHWRRGDCFQPIGMARPVKLQDWFTNQKVPRARRHELVVATTAAGEIFWVEDQRIAEGFKVTPATRRRLKWTWERR